MKLTKTKIMIKVGLAAVLFGLVYSANAQFKSGMAFRTRMETYTIRTTWDADTQPQHTFTDFRIRPWFNYEASKKISSRFMLEIGNMRFGNTAQGLQMGSKPASVVKMKRAYLDLQFTEVQRVAPIHEAKIRLGLMGEKDPHSLVLEEDIAGIKYSGRYNDLRYHLGYYVPAEGVEKNVNGTTYSYNSTTSAYGTGMILADISYRITPKITAGLYNIIDMDTRAADTAADVASSGYDPGNIRDYVNKNSTKMWINPYFKGDFGMITIDALLSYNSRSAEYEAVGKDINVDQTQNDELNDHRDNGSGIALSLKSNIKATKDLNIGVNLAYIPGDEDGKDYWMQYKNKYQNGLEMIATGVSDGNSYNYINRGAEGIMIPALTFTYKVNDDITLRGGFGMAMTTEDVKWTAADGTEKSDTNLGTEILLGARVRLLEKMTLNPYFGMFMPGEANTKASDKQDSQMRTGIVASINF